jgi:hypothetical protein
MSKYKDRQQDAEAAPIERRQPRTSISLNPMNVRRLAIALVLVVCIAAPARDHGSPMPAAELINEVVANELTDRLQERKWMYVIDKREGKQTLTEE